jgi:hypothetical protein
MADVIGFLEARIAEDEFAARGTAPDTSGTDDTAGSSVWPLWAARVLAECAAKRKILENVPLVTDISSQTAGTSGYVLMCLASVYSHHPDYQEGWRVDDLDEAPQADKQRLSARGAQL